MSTPTAPAMSETTATIDQAGLHHAASAVQALDRKPTQEGIRTVDANLPKPLCMNGDGAEARAQRERQVAA